MELARHIETTIQLFMYITEEGKISSDLGKLHNILSSKSSLDTETFKDFEE